MLARRRRDRRARSETGESSRPMGTGTAVEGTGERVMAVEAYCVKCRTKREMKNPTEVTMKNGRPAMEGLCPVCGTKLFRMMSGGAKSDEGKAAKKQ